MRASPPPPAAEQACLAGWIVARGDLREARAAAALPIAGLSSLHAVAALLAARQHEPSRRAIRVAETSTETDVRGAGAAQAQRSG